MACLITSEEVDISAASGSVMDDGRGFTTAGTGHTTPSEFKSPYKRAASQPVGKKRSLRGFSAPAVGPVSLEDLDLEDTLVAGEAFASSSGSEEINSGRGGGSFYTESSMAGNISSYSKAVNKGRLESMGSSHVQRSRKHSMLHSVMSRLRSASISSSTSSVVDDLDSRSLTSAKVLRKELLKQGESKQEGESKLDTTDLLFAIMNKKYAKEKKRAKMLATLLTFSETDVNQRAPSGMTALHLALKEYDMESVKVLVAYGANINATNGEGKTPLDMLRLDVQDAPCTSTSEPLSSPEHKQTKHRSTRQTRKVSRLKCIELLKSIGAVGNEFAARLSIVPSVQSFPEVPSSSPSLSRHKKQFEEVLDWEAKITLHYSDLERNIQSRLQNTTRAGRNAIFSPDTAISLAVQLQEMSLFQKAGSRVLCLDGGGMKGLVQLEMLTQLELKTGRRITELFDWIIGTSTGGVIALGLVYAKKSLVQLRQLYFRMKDEVFGKVKGAVSFNTAGLERIFKKEFTETRCMDDESYPRVLISAVKKDHINLKLHFFNNCFNDDHCKHWPVWKVARYTCAAPVLFGEADEYVDGGVLANNPSDSGLSRIQTFYRSRGEKLPLSLVVSVGCGKYPFQELGNVDFLFVGNQGWSSLAGTSNLMALLSYALVEPSVADENCRSRCEEQNVRYFRLNPRLEEVMDSGETDLDTLIAAILQTRREMVSRKEFSDLVLCLHELSEASRKMHAHLNGEESSDSSVGSNT